jgi:NAD(P)-dependent dehydrogenase (short-subunit alcohol dehydrogenase family)
MSTPERVAYVSGGASGIGLAIVRALLARDWRVAICGRDPERLERAARELDSARLLTTRADVAEEADVRRWVAEARERLGPPDLLVNNAGIYEEYPIATLPTDSWDRVMAINLRGTFLCTREVLPLMQERGGGYVVNIASISGKRGLPGMGAYTASKFGVLGLADCLRHEGKPYGIRTTSICPGWVNTPMAAGTDIPPEAMVQPADVAATVLFLLDLPANVVVPEILIDMV